MSKLEKLIWYAIDFDGTLAVKNPDYSIGEPIWENIDKLRQLDLAGYKIIIYTSRHWEDYILIEEWLERYDIPYKSIVCGKILAHRYVDDKAINASEESWL